MPAADVPRLVLSIDTANRPRAEVPLANGEALFDFVRYFCRTADPQTVAATTWWVEP